MAKFPYKLKKSDFFILGMGVSAKLVADSRESATPMSYDEISSLQRTDISSLNRGATYNWNQGLHKGSDFTRGLLLFAPSLMVVNSGVQTQFGHSFIYGAMYLEVAMLTFGLTDLSKTMAQRIRPYLYNPDVSMEDKQNQMKYNNGFDSFWSGHTAMAFASAVFLSKTYSDIYGKNTFSKVIWGSSLALASTTGYLRYKSGNHYPTDILVGALVGSAIGFIVPSMHKKEKRNDYLSYSVGAGNFMVRYTF
ncbi:phosphatase PAP2 family protein [Plebeiibacterium marinum]|uniref:Phosphatase PAP2 family protein n=1 Tax=Plebeiibacterium marinum TaxID=2992111 RepID=A0AAE3MCW1_9BACT|nr:phosphatase PAP2 family protein [Plebeiobacterium marinum]MCW3805111.1 phosphatase PAP2 family protein [Plebeiobacterium marinum]